MMRAGDITQFPVKPIKLFVGYASGSVGDQIHVSANLAGSWISAVLRRKRPNPELARVRWIGDRLWRLLGACRCDTDKEREDTKSKSLRYDGPAPDDVQKASMQASILIELSASVAQRL